MTKQFFKITVLFLLGMPLLVTTEIFAQSNPTISEFQDGARPTVSYTGTRDSYISENSLDFNAGAETDLTVDGDDPGGSGLDKVPLIKWNISTVPPESTVQSASITINVTNVSDGVFKIFEVKFVLLKSKIVNPCSEIKQYGLGEVKKRGCSW